MRRAMSVALSALIALSPSIQAAAQESGDTMVISADFVSLAKRYGERRARASLRQTVPQYQRLALSKEPTALSKERAAAEHLMTNVAHTGQALVLLMVLSGVELVRREIAIAKLKQGAVDVNEVYRLSGQVAEQILLGGSTWFNLMGAGAASSVARQPIQVLNAMINNSTARPIFKNLLQSGIVSLVTFVGWELGGELWHQARESLNDDDFERTSNVGLLLGRSLTAMFTPDFATNADLRTAKKLFANMLDILVRDTELRSLWLYNAWRMKIATGSFVSVITAMVGATVVGTALFPGAGTIGGFCFGVVGGVLALYVPESVNDRITGAIRATRLRVARGRIEALLGGLTNGIQDEWSALLPAERRYDARLGAIATGLSQMRPSRESGINVYFEQDYELYSRLKVLEGQKEIARQANNAEALTTLENEISNGEGKLKAALMRTAEFYRERVEELRGIAANEPDQWLRDQYRVEIRKLGYLRDVVILLTDNLLVKDDADDVGKAAQKLLTKFYLFGFSENDALKK